MLMDDKHVKIVSDIIEKDLNRKPSTITRMTRGITNEVYLVDFADQKVVVRMNTNPEQLKGSVKYITLFDSLGIKVPKILSQDYTKKSFPFAYHVLSYIEGKDIGDVIESLTESELIGIAHEIVEIFQKLEKIPTNGKFGWIGFDESKSFNKWSEVINLEKAEERNLLTKVIDEDLLNKMRIFYSGFKPYLESVKSTMYYADLNYKNVLVNNGKFTGLIDLDDITYGDPLEALGRIKACWHNTKYGDTYLNAIEKGLGLKTKEKIIVNYYAVITRYNWLSYEGVKFNANTTNEIDYKRVENDKKILIDLLQGIGNHVL